MRALIVGLTLVFGAIAFADDPMTKIIFRQESTEVAPNSYAAKPKTIYLWQSTKGRVEQALDIEHNTQQLFIADGKDGWIIDEVSKTGQHMIDPSTDHNFYAPIIPQPNAQTPAPLRSFELGHELAFMREQNVSPKAVTESGRKLMLYECEGAGYTLRFYLAFDDAKPVKSEVLQGGKVILRLIYLEYSTLPADPSLFAPPAGVKIIEA
jgi:hypothetical protein